MYSDEAANDKSGMVDGEVGGGDLHGSAVCDGLIRVYVGMLRPVREQTL